MFTAAELAHRLSTWQHIAHLPMVRDTSTMHHHVRSGLSGVTGMIGKFLLSLNRLEVHNLEGYERLRLETSREGRPLITSFNHCSVYDDPFLWGVLTPRQLFDAGAMRWSLGAEELMYTNPLFNKFFAAGQVIPIRRGDGIYQPGMDYAMHRLSLGMAVNIFPEARVNQERDLIRLKWGIGRMVSECAAPLVPVVLPVAHRGMEEVAPEGQTYWFRTNKRITVLFGEPIYFEDVLERHRRHGSDAETVRKHITDIIQERMCDLNDQAHKLH